MRYSKVRILVGIGLVAVAAVLASIAGTWSSHRSTNPAPFGAFVKGGDPDHFSKSSSLATIAQPESARLSDDSYAGQKYAENAYPADTIPFDLTQSAIASWNSAVAAASKGNGKSSTGTWTSVGPDQATYPGVLNRSGSLYHDSGRITALSLKPGCSPSSCELLLAAAGGGIWFTDKAMQGEVKWQF